MSTFTVHMHKKHVTTNNCYCVTKGKFLLRNNTMSTFLSFILFLFSEMTSPALEKSLSDGTDDPGIARYFLAGMFRGGN